MVVPGEGHGSAAPEATHASVASVTWTARTRPPMSVRRPAHGMEHSGNRNHRPGHRALLHDRADSGRVYDTERMLKVVRTIAAILGLDPKLFGAHSLRIGGASDMREAKGDYEGARLLRERGRWMSDIAGIYARLPVATHLEASRAMTLTVGVDIERMTGWTQPATR